MSGPVKTEFGEVARREGASTGMPPARKFFYVSKQRVVAEALSGLEKAGPACFRVCKLRLPDGSSDRCHCL